MKKKGHKVVPSSSLLSDDLSVLLTTAGMQQFKSYYSGSADPFKSPHPSLGGRPIGSKNTVSIQKSFRTSDIEEVGDKTHLTFFEMLGNFSFDGYFKEMAIQYAFEYLNEIGIDIDFVTVFKGDKEIPYDEESEKIWKKLGIKEIRQYGREDNFWGPTGVEGPCGPCTEVYVNGVEVWNIVFNEYYKSNNKYEKIEKGGVDTGMGLERLAVALQKKDNIFETDLFSPLMDCIEGNFSLEQKRIITDHLRGSAFLLSDGVCPSNKEAGYILRRLIRRVFAMYYISNINNNIEESEIINVSKDFFDSIFDIIEQEYGFFYKNIKSKDIRHEFYEECDAFLKILITGIRKLNNMDDLSAKDAFRLYESLGLPFEVIKEISPEKTKNISYEDFQKEFLRHKKDSKRESISKFGGHGLILDTGELKARNEEEVIKVKKLHTATHLLQAGLRKVLGDTVRQAGSDITADRLRFDFSFDRRLNEEEVEKVEQYVNDCIDKNLKVNFEEVEYSEAIKSGALYFEKETYPEKVKIYTIEDDKDKAFSKELCGGPHIENTKEMKNFKIIKQDSVSAGVRRIRAIVE